MVQVTAKGNKAKIHASVDICLFEIMEQHCKCENITRSAFISQAVGEKLNIPLNSDSTVDKKTYAEFKIREVENCIDKLNMEKKELKKLLGDD